MKSSAFRFFTQQFSARSEERKFIQEFTHTRLEGTELSFIKLIDELYKKYWPADVHVIGKEIVRFHAIIWPAILMALDIPLPKRIFGHGWLLFGGDKRIRTAGLLVANEALYQLSHNPKSILII